MDGMGCIGSQPLHCGLPVPQLLGPHEGHRHAALRRASRDQRLGIAALQERCDKAHVWAAAMGIRSAHSVLQGHEGGGVALALGRHGMREAAESDMPRQRWPPLKNTHQLRDLRASGRAAQHLRQSVHQLRALAGRVGQDRGDLGDRGARDAHERALLRASCPRALRQFLDGQLASAGAREAEGDVHRLRQLPVRHHVRAAREQ
mmetsp:Transcript_9697/g.28090  ORF Transcript_9697/g.28090 Transcript_9697/m.28090 type:complete len:204 (+) Transcript_9697:1735-2346(+)